MEVLDLDAIEARANAATPGPWSPHWISRWSSGPTSGVWYRVASPGPDEPSQAAIVSHVDSSHDDAVFLARARTDIPALVAEVRRLRTIESAARAYVDAYWPVEGMTSHDEEVAFRNLENAVDAR